MKSYKKIVFFIVLALCSKSTFSKLIPKAKSSMLTKPKNQLTGQDLPLKKEKKVKNKSALSKGFLKKKFYEGLPLVISLKLMLIVYYKTNFFGKKESFSHAYAKKPTGFTEKALKEELFNFQEEIGLTVSSSKNSQKDLTNSSQEALLKKEKSPSPPSQSSSSDESVLFSCESKDPSPSPIAPTISPEEIKEEIKEAIKDFKKLGKKPETRKAFFAKSIQLIAESDDIEDICALVTPFLDYKEELDAYNLLNHNFSQKTKAAFGKSIDALKKKVLALKSWGWAVNWQIKEQFNLYKSNFHHVLFFLKLAPNFETAYQKEKGAQKSVNCFMTYMALYMLKKKKNETGWPFRSTLEEIEILTDALLQKEGTQKCQRLQREGKALPRYYILKDEKFNICEASLFDDIRQIGKSK